MAYSEALADRIRERFAELPDVSEKEMMGGLTFLYNDKMCVGIIKDDTAAFLQPNLSYLKLRYEIFKNCIILR